MQKIMFLSLLTMFLMFSIPQINVLAGKNSSIPAGAKEYAENKFYEIVIDMVDDEEAEHYGFMSDSKDIRFGELHETYTLSQEFIAKNDKLNNLNDGVIKTNEWISVIYQDDQPVNVIGVYEREDGEFELSVFGYGKDLAFELDSIQNGSLKLIYEMPIDAWYWFNNGKVQPVNDSAKQSINSEYNLEEFRQLIQERYKDSQKKSLLLPLVVVSSMLLISLYVFKRKRQHNRNAK
ncbi:hypothetical protein [Bacillus solitudinis]|uniref:hypothetical protein n=1 Tax=Bacillus solitudinis TaxID=2014074 RepID=UPI000C24DAD2|nr:hypothetical protein [Bacillus solitudinis]